MYYINDVKEIAKRPELLAGLAPFLNLATIIPALTAGGIFTIAIVAIKKVKSENAQLVKKNNRLKNELDEYVYEAEYEEHEEDDEPLEQPLESAYQAVNSTVEQLFNATVCNSSTNGSDTVETTVQNMSDEALKKEMIRQAMSELGKRSAAARARKKIGD